MSCWDVVNQSEGDEVMFVDNGPRSRRLEDLKVLRCFENEYGGQVALYLKKIRCLLILNPSPRGTPLIDCRGCLRGHIIRVRPSRGIFLLGAGFVAIPRGAFNGFPLPYNYGQ